MKNALLGSAVIGLLSVAGSALAGAKTAPTVVIDSVNFTATGAMGSARSSSDSVQYIACTHKYLVGSTTFATCAARASNNTSLSCWTTDEALFSAVASINTDSYIMFRTDGAGQCTEVQVTTDSRHAPKAP